MQEPLRGDLHVGGFQQFGDRPVPLIRRAEVRGGVGEHQAVDALRNVDAQPLRDDSPQRQAQHVHPLQAQGIQQLHRVAPQPVQGIRAARDVGGAVAARVVAQQPEVLGESRHLAVPHVEVGTDGVREQQHRLVLVTVEAVGDADAIAGGDGGAGLRSHVSSSALAAMSSTYDRHLQSSITKTGTSL